MLGNHISASNKSAGVYGQFSASFGHIPRSFATHPAYFPAVFRYTDKYLSYNPKSRADTIRVVPTREGPFYSSVVFTPRLYTEFRSFSSRTRANKMNARTANGITTMNTGVNASL